MLFLLQVKRQGEQVQFLVHPEDIANVQAHSNNRLILIPSGDPNSAFYKAAVSPQENFPAIVHAVRDALGLGQRDASQDAAQTTPSNQGAGRTISVIRGSFSGGTLTMRPFDGKKGGYILDVSGRDHGLGFPPQHIFLHLSPKDLEAVWRDPNKPVNFTVILPSTLTDKDFKSEDPETCPTFNTQFPAEKLFWDSTVLPNLSGIGNIVRKGLRLGEKAPQPEEAVDCNSVKIKGMVNGGTPGAQGMEIAVQKPDGTTRTYYADIQSIEDANRTGQPLLLGASKSLKGMSSEDKQVGACVTRQIQQVLKRPQTAAP